MKNNPDLFPFRIHEVDRVPGAVDVGADGVVLLGHRILAEPGRGPGIIEPGTEVQVGTAGSCRRDARKRACAGLLACNFLATEAVPDGRLRRTRYGGPYPALAAEGVVIKPLEDRSLAILYVLVRTLLERFLPSDQEMLVSITAGLALVNNVFLSY